MPTLHRSMIGDRDRISLLLALTFVVPFVQGAGAQPWADPVRLDMRGGAVPITVEYVAGGPTSAADAFGDDCVGYINFPYPDHVIVVPEDTRLRIAVSSDADTTLVVSGSLGFGPFDLSTVRCNDDAGQSRNPEVSGFFPAGEYEIYVGTYRKLDDNPPYTLLVQLW